MRIHHHHHLSFYCNFLRGEYSTNHYFFTFNLKCCCAVVIHILYSNVILYRIILFIVHKCSAYRLRYIAASL